MSDTETNGASAPVAPATPALKSSDTSAKAKAASAPAPEPKAAPEAQPEAKAPDAAPATKPDAGGDDSPDTDAPEAEAPRNKQQQRLPRWMQERLERERQVTRERTRAEMLAEFQRNTPAPSQAPTAEAHQPAPAKTLEDFDFDTSAFVAYQVQEGLAAERRREQQAQAQREQAEKLDTFKARVDTFEARVGAGAWEDIASSPINADPAFAPLVAAFMGDAHDLDIAYHLAQHLDEARHLLTLSPLARARELAKLADRFEQPTAPAPEAPEVTPKTVTKAPPPPSKLVGGKPSVDINNPQMSTADRIAAWKKARAAS